MCYGFRRPLVLRAHDMSDEFTSPARALPPQPAVHVRMVDPGRGASWWSEAWRLFVPGVGSWILIVIVGFVLNVLLALVPLLGSIASHLLFPLFMAGLMLGCRAVDRGEPLSIAHLFAGFGPKAGSLLIVGLIYIAATIAILVFVVAVIAVVFGAAILTHLASGWESVTAWEALNGMAMIALVAALLFLLLYLPLVMAVWFAPALVVLRNAQPWDAMKLSFVGSVKNILPFLVYGVIGMLLAVVASIPLLLGWLVLAPVSIASVYSSYCDIFEEPAALPSAAAGAAA
jgi:uncharacterized membrane protein